MEHESWSRIVTEHYEKEKEKEEAKIKENDFNDSLNNPETIQHIRDNGTDEQKLKAFDHITKNKPTEHIELTDSEKREARMKIRVPFKNNLINNQG